MRGMIATALVFVAAATAPAFADTLKEVTTHGVVMEAGGAKIDIVFAPDGKFTAFDGAVTGKWRIDGDRLCSMDDATLKETCAVYPEGKKSGDTFVISTGQGEVSITIK